MKKLLSMILALIMLFGFCAFGEAEFEILVEDGVAITNELIVEYGYDYYSTEEVALYLYVFWELPPNFLTKDEAYDYGWQSSKGNLWDVVYGLVIGGDRFGNREGILPTAKGRQYYECDVNYDGGFRDAERIVFSSDGLIYYTGDHYETLELLYEGWYGNDDGAYTYPPEVYDDYYSYGY